MCSSLTYADILTRTCLTNNASCPIVNNLKQYADQTNTSCVSKCAAPYWGENSTWVCQASCLTGIRYTPTRVCIDICPADPNGTGLFNNGGTCDSVCQAGYFTDIQNKRSCQLKCSTSPVQQFADTTTMSCVLICPS